jgi:23S rRNA pseudouridine2605 synthase
VAEDRLQKILAEAGVASRRGAEALIAAGRVTVDGEVASLGQRADPERAVVAIDGRPIGGPPAHVYLALNKPPGVTSTTGDRHAARTVVELVPAELRRRAGRVYPVGRLDQESEGLILLTNDGSWTERVLHPSHEIEREYAVGLGRPLTPGERADLAAGIVLDEGLATVVHLRPMTEPEIRAVAAVMAPPPPPLSWYRVTLTQGWKRQIRRMCGAVGVPVVRLVRVRVGTLRLGELAPGAVRVLSRREAEALLDGGSRRPAPRHDSHASPPSR